jgi:hypothetical protein
MNEPVFVIHGVGNRNPEAFAAQVERLQRATGNRWDMKPVFWGDLGAKDEWITLTIPSLGGEAFEVRDDTNPVPLVDVTDALAIGLLAADVAQPSAGVELRDDREAAAALFVAEAAVRRLQMADETASIEVRDDEDTEEMTADVREAIVDLWSSTAWLQHVSDEVLLSEVGSAIVGPLLDADGAFETAGEELREEPHRGALRGFIGRRLAELDRVVGAAVASVAGRVNTSMRRELAPGVMRFFGDVLVYQRHRQEIHDRVRTTIDAADPTLGRASNRPVRIVGHSLGGVIAVDLATADKPLWTRSLVTFGSQSPLFHLCDPRGGLLTPYLGQHRVQLPDSLAGWTNLWEPMDPLAFIAGQVFAMHDGQPPRDVPVDHLASSGLWTHSAYWHLTQVTSAIQDALSDN